MSYCDKHIPLDGCIPGDEVMVHRYDECPVCVREERDRLREENDFLSYAMQQEIVGLGLLRDERDRLREEVTRLRDLIPQAWSAGQARVIGSHKDFQQTHPTFREWMESKGLL